MTFQKVVVVNLIHMQVMRSGVWKLKRGIFKLVR